MISKLAQVMFKYHCIYQKTHVKSKEEIKWLFDLGYYQNFFLKKTQRVCFQAFHEIQAIFNNVTLTFEVQA